MARQDDNIALKIILGVVIGFFALIIFGTAVFFIFSTRSKISKLEDEKQKLVETQNMATVQTPGQILPDGTVVPNPQQQTTPQTTVKKTSNSNKSNQLVPVKERTLVTKSSDLELVNIRKSANSNSAIVNALDDDQEVRIKAKKGEWYQVEDSNGNKGYIHKSQLQKKSKKTAKQEHDDTGTNEQE